MATCQSFLLLKVASFSTFCEVALPGFVTVTEVMSQEGEQEWGAVIQRRLAAKKQFKLSMLMGSFLLQTYSFQAMRSYQKENTRESMFDLFALPILTRCFCLAFCLQISVVAKLPCNREGYLGAQPMYERLGWRLFDSRSQREGPFLGGNSLRISEAPSVKFAGCSHLCCALVSSRDEMRCEGPGIIKTTEPVGSNTAGAGKKMPVPPLLTWLFLSLFQSPCEADRAEAVEQQGRRKGDSDCLFHVRGQFHSVPLQLEEHLSTLTSANHSSAAHGEAYLTEVPLFFWADMREDTVISKISI